MEINRLTVEKYNFGWMIAETADKWAVETLRCG